ncbi:hypothetical protein OJAV_G00178320 [Oryzias javanicus]|uniref:Fibronectin type-III domain-containing protein n=1 Tax=Oryzias javanicus TaxID=123683 RepID=A0A437CBM3_ORYJA|nr:hypothetical protein OJAV_G00178320 [Oryzias javanicus]
MDHNPGGVFFLLFLTTLTYSNAADHLPAPTQLQYKWLDPFILEVSWKNPPDLPRDCRPAYMVEELNEGRRRTQVTENQTFSQFFLSEKMISSPLMLSVAAECLDLKSKAANITISPTKPHAELVKNFKCFEDHPRECTWIPQNRSQNLRFLYRSCSRLEEPLHTCVQQSEEHVCFMNQRDLKRDVCVVVESDTHMNTFKPEHAVHVPPLDVTADGNYLLLTWTPSDVRNLWKFELWYKECDEPKTATFKESTVRIPYDPCCIYHFQYRVRCTGSEIFVSSSNSSVQTYGSGKCYNAAIIVAIVAPILLFLCVLLSCYCFRRHKDIICPIIPYPSNLLKELMNGTKDPGKPNTLLTTDQEVLDDVKVSLVTDRTSQQSV